MIPSLRCIVCVCVYVSMADRLFLYIGMPLGMFLLDYLPEELFMGW